MYKWTLRIFDFLELSVMCCAINMNWILFRSFENVNFCSPNNNLRHVHGLNNNSLPLPVSIVCSVGCSLLSSCQIHRWRWWDWWPTPWALLPVFLIAGTTSLRFSSWLLLLVASPLLSYSPIMVSRSGCLFLKIVVNLNINLDRRRFSSFRSLLGERSRLAGLLDVSAIIFRLSSSFDLSMLNSMIFFAVNFWFSFLKIIFCTCCCNCGVSHYGCRLIFALLDCFFHFSQFLVLFCLFRVCYFLLMFLQLCQSPIKTGAFFSWV